MKYIRILIVNVLAITTIVSSIFPYPVQASTQVIKAGSVSASATFDGSFYRITNDVDSFGSGTFTGIGDISSVTNVLSVVLDDGLHGGSSVYVRPWCSSGGIVYYGSVIFVTSSNPNQSVTGTWVTNPNTGLAWTTSSINSASWGANVYNGIGGFAFTVTGTGTVTVTYTLIPPSVTTDSATDIQYTGGVHSALLNGEITSDGGATPDLEGFAWSTTSNTTAPLNIVPPATYTTNWTGGASAIGAFDHTASALTKGTTYYYRAYAHNSQGWAWGDEVSFTALNDPSITTSAASQVSSLTARLNASASNDGGEDCTVRFLRGTATGVYTSNTTVTGTFNTGDAPYADISGLAIGTTYYVKAEITNTVSTKFGSEVTFTTSTGVSAPTNLVAIPSATSMSLSWTKGTGANKTLIVYKLGSYPTSKTDGTQTYFDVQSSTVKIGLTAGTTYYIMAWGETSGFYSTSNTTALITTLATVAGGDDLDAPTTPDTWFQSPDYTNMENMPFYEIVNFAGNAFEVPLSTWWYMGALIVSMVTGIIFYSSIGNHNLFLSILAVGGMIVIMSIFKLVPLWNIIPFAIIAVTGIFVGERR